MQRTINKINEHFYSVRKQGIDRAHDLYQRTFLFEGHDTRDDFQHYGVVVPHESLEYDENDIDRLAEHVSDERLDALWNGAEPTNEERQLYREIVIEQVEQSNFDADVIPAYGIYRLTHTDGREVFAVETVIGYSFSGVHETLRGIFSSADDALKDLATLGHVIAHD
jgi:hypothetical protein